MADAQQAVSLCSYVTTNGVTTCQPISSTNQLPITLGTSGASTAIGNTVTNGTSGSVLFINPTATLAQNNANFFWDNTNNRLGIGTASPTFPLTVIGSAAIQQITFLTGFGTIDVATMPLSITRSEGAADASIVFGGTGSTQTGRISAVGTSGLSFQSGNGSTTWATFSSSGQLSIGTATPRNSALLDVNGVFNASSSVFLTGLTTGTNADFLCLGAAGQVFLQASSCTISKREFKENIYDLDDSALDEVMEFKPVQFNMKAQKDSNGNIVKNADKNFNHTQIGFIAEDVAEIDPRVTVYEQDERTPKSWDERKFVALLTKAVQVEQHEIESMDQTKITHKNKFGRFMDWLEGVR